MSYPAPPEIIKVGYRDYKVRLFDHWEAVDKQRFGSCDSNAGEITLDREMDPFKAVDIFLHEITHAGWATFNQPVKKITEENVCEAMGRILATVFRDNPALVDWLRDTLK